jgi:S1-C subfamily serine protease
MKKERISMRSLIHWLSAFTFLFSITACQTIRPTTAQAPPPLWAGDSVLRVTVTSQGYNFHRPWQQRRPITRRAIGAIVPGHRILVTGLLVANARYIELETIDTREKLRASVDVVDYEANLALLKPENPEFLAGRKPLALTEREIADGDDLTIWQVKPNGDIISSIGQVISVEISAYTTGNFFLTYRLSNSLQYRFDNLTLPVVKGRTLAGLVLPADEIGQTISVIAAPVISHFLQDARSDTYQGFPLAGFRYGPTLDPQLRRYIDLPSDQSGIYIQKVIKGGPADRAGLKSGDVVTHIAGKNVSNTGQFDHPVYGQTSLSHLIRTQHFAGDTVEMGIVRGSELMTLNVQLDHRRPDEYLVPPYVVDQAPRFQIVAGLVFQELSMSYLREYGKNWHSRAPVHLLYYNQNQDYLHGDQREKIVIISSVIPTSYTIGYEQLANLVVQKINGKPIGKLADITPALDHPLDGFHKIEVDQHPNVIFLDPGEIGAIHDLIRKRYRIPVPNP